MQQEGVRLINKTMQRSDLESQTARAVVAELEELLAELKHKGLKASSWYGAFDLETAHDPYERLNRGYGYEPLPGVLDDANFPWFLYWEISWVVQHAGFESGQRVLDLGGSSSLFSYYLASKGLDVTTVDLQEDLVRNADEVATQTGWPLTNHAMDMRTLAFDEPFDHITSICVYEHIPMYDRVEINRRIDQLLVPGGRFSITFDYRNPSRLARIDTPADVRAQFVEPSGLAVRENEEFVDTGESYLLHPFFHPDVPREYRKDSVKLGHFRPWELLRTMRENGYTFGALFQEKPSG